MASLYTAKSNSITNQDAVLPVENPSGNGAQGYRRNVSDSVAVTTGQLGTTATIIGLVRVPTNAKLKSLRLSSDAALDSSTGLVLSVGAYYSDAYATNSVVDGTPPALSGTVISATAFASALVFQSTFAEVNALKSFSVVKRNQPLWQALALAADPGGFIDIVVAVGVIATTAAAGNLGIDADFVV